MGKQCRGRVGIAVTRRQQHHARKARLAHSLQQRSIGQGGQWCRLGRGRGRPAPLQKACIVLPPLGCQGSFKDLANLVVARSFLQKLHRSGLDELSIRAGDDLGSIDQAFAQ
ncbi:hypothetical protein D3C72_1721320 [compost metagenome]